MRLRRLRWTALAGLLLSASSLLASPWTVVSSDSDKTIYTLDLGASPPTVYGPFLGSSVVAGTAGIIRVSPNQAGALLTDMDLGTIHFLDLTDPRSPRVTGASNCCRSPVLALATSSNGRFAAVGMGPGFSIVNLQTLASTTQQTFTTRSAVSIAPDNSTVIAADFTNGDLVYGPVNSSLTDFAIENHFPDVPLVRSLIVAEDGQTVLAAAANDVTVLRLTSGALVPGNPPHFFFIGPQSFVAEPLGRRIYLLGSTLNDSSISTLNVDSPGAVSVTSTDVLTLPSPALRFPGANLAITPDGARLLIVDGLTGVVQVIRVSDWNVTSVPTGARSLSAIAVFSPQEAAAVPALSRAWTLALAALVAVAAIYRLAR